MVVFCVTKKIVEELVFNTQGFTFPEARILSENLNSTFDFNTGVKQKKAAHSYILKKYKEIMNIISPYIIDSMKYKLPRVKVKLMT